MPEHRSNPPVALTIAGSDSGGGAGIQADLRTFAAFGVHGTSAITAVTAQNTCEVADLQMLPARIIRAQINAVLEDFPVSAIKIGMLGTASIARCVGESLDRHRLVPLVVDPVLVATSGANLARGRLVAAIRQHLVARADLLTPNLPEAEQLLGRPLGSRGSLLEAALELRQMGASAVLLKGGHLAGPQVHDVLVSERGVRWFSHSRIEVEGHGTGCTLASAITAGLARGEVMEDAVETAIGFVNRALQSAYKPGRGRIVVLDHLAASKFLRLRSV